MTHDDQVKIVLAAGATKRWLDAPISRLPIPCTPNQEIQALMKKLEAVPYPQPLKP